MPEPRVSILRHPKVEATSLALVAGYVDGYAIRIFGTFVSFMSGNTTFAGIRLGRVNLAAALPPALAIVAFLGGSFTGNWFAHSNLRSSRAVIFATAAFVLALFVIFGFHHPLHPNADIPLLSFAMGLINPALVRVGREPINLTFVTGTLNRIGSHLAQASLHIKPTDPQGPQDTQLRRAMLETSVWIAFLAGAILSAIAAPLGALELLPASALLILFALIAVPKLQERSN
ncbi:MAG: DUF1275 domain-containing protein [Acidobacteria bacterium]|nr:DUF1275 domain-containing protein [Acidobacteriota bacterium]